MRRLTIYGLMIFNLSFLWVGISNSNGQSRESSGGLVSGQPPSIDSWFKFTIKNRRKNYRSGLSYGCRIPEKQYKKPSFDSKGNLIKPKISIPTPSILHNPPPSFTIKKSIQELNYSESGVGINPLNGGLISQVEDLSKISRFYSSKRVWVYDIYKNNSYYSPRQTLKRPGLLGLGWDMHFGRLYAEDGKTVYESPAGDKNTFESGKTYDGTFMMLRGDTIFSKDGGKIVFANNLAIKFIDPDGLYSRVYYSEHSFSGMTDTLADSIKAPTGQATYLFYSRYNGTENSYIMLDSIKTKGMSGASQCVKYI